MTRRRSKERGSIIVIAMLVLVALISLGGLTTLSVRGGIQSSGHDRFRAVALYGAESGAAIAMDFLRRRVGQAPDYWTAFINPDNSVPFVPPGIPGNGVLPGVAGNLFDPEMRVWYEIEVVNNRDDGGYSDDGVTPGTDMDGRVIIRSTGHGPGDTLARIEWEVRVDGPIGIQCGEDPAQKGAGAGNTGVIAGCP